MSNSKAYQTNITRGRGRGRGRPRGAYKNPYRYPTYTNAITFDEKVQYLKYPNYYHWGTSNSLSSTIPSLMDTLYQNPNNIEQPNPNNIEQPPAATLNILSSSRDGHSQNVEIVNSVKVVERQSNVVSESISAVPVSIPLQRSHVNLTKATTANSTTDLPTLVPISHAKGSPLRNETRRKNVVIQNVIGSEENSSGDRDKLMNKILQKDVSLIKDIIENPRKATKYAAVLNNMSKDKRLSLSKQLRNTILSEEPQGNVCFIGTSTDVSIALENLPQKVSNEISQLLHLTPETDTDEVNSNINDLMNIQYSYIPTTKNSTAATSTSQVNNTTLPTMSYSYVNSYNSQKQVVANSTSRPVIKCRALKDLISEDGNLFNNDMLSSNFQFESRLEKNERVKTVPAKQSNKSKMTIAKTIAEILPKGKKRGRKVKNVQSGAEITTKKLKTMKVLNKKVAPTILQAISANTRNTPTFNISIVTGPSTTSSNETILQFAPVTTLPEKDTIIAQPNSNNSLSQIKSVQIATGNVTAAVAVEKPKTVLDNTTNSIELDDNSDGDVICINEENPFIIICDSDTEESTNNNQNNALNELNLKSDNCSNDNNKSNCSNNINLTTYPTLSENYSKDIAESTSNSLNVKRSASLNVSQVQVSTLVNDKAITATESNCQLAEIIDPEKQVASDNRSNLNQTTEAMETGSANISDVDNAISNSQSCLKSKNAQKNKNIINCAVNSGNKESPSSAKTNSSTCNIKNSDKIANKQLHSNTTSKDTTYLDGGVSTTFRDTLSYRKTNSKSNSKRVRESETSSTSKDSETGSESRRQSQYERNKLNSLERDSRRYSKYDSRKYNSSYHSQSSSRSSYYRSRRYSEHSSKYTRDNYDESRYSDTESISNVCYYRRSSYYDQDKYTYYKRNRRDSSNRIFRNQSSRSIINEQDNVIRPANLCLNSNLEGVTSTLPSSSNFLKQISNLEIATKEILNEVTNRELAKSDVENNDLKSSSSPVADKNVAHSPIRVEDEITISSTCSESSDNANVTSSLSAQSQNKSQSNSLLSNNQSNILQNSKNISNRSEDKLHDGQNSNTISVVSTVCLSDNTDLENSANRSEGSEIIPTESNNDGTNLNLNSPTPKEDISSIVSINDANSTSDNNLDGVNNKTASLEPAITYSDIVNKIREIDMKILSLQQEKIELCNLYYKQSDISVSDLVLSGTLLVNNLQLLNTTPLNSNKQTNLKRKFVKKPILKKKEKVTINLKKNKSKVSKAKAQVNVKPKKRKVIDRDKSTKKDNVKKPKLEEEVVENSNADFIIIEDDEEIKLPIKSEQIELFNGNFVGHNSPIVALHLCENTILASSELGLTYQYCCVTGKLLHHYSGHRSAVTCIYVVDNTKLFTAALDCEMRCFQLESEENIWPPKLLAGPAQAIECYDNQLYIGTRKGQIHAYDIQANKLEEPYSCGDSCILAICCTREGPRRVLLVAAKEQPLSLRDAQNGLLLRSFQFPDTKLVLYSLILNEGVVFCGTNGQNVIAFNFMSGANVLQLKGGRGAVCLKMYKGLLFSGCYDGFIYIHCMKTGELIHKMRGPGKMLLAISIIDDKIISASKDKSLAIWNMPSTVLKHCNANS